LFAIAVPMMCESILGQVIATLSTAVLSDYSQSAVAAVGTVGTLTTAVSLIFTVISTGATVVVSNYIGADDERGMKESSFSGLLAGAVMGTVAAITLHFFGDDLLFAMNITGETHTQAFTYLKIISSVYTVTALSSGISALMQCHGHARYVVISSVASSIINVLLNSYVVYVNKLPIFMGVKGIAFASIASMFIALIIKLVFFIKLKVRFSIPKAWADLKMYVLKILKIGVPSGISSGSYAFSKVMTTSFIALMGEIYLSANIYLINILRYTYLFSVAIGSANALLVGRLCGAKRYDHAEKLNARLVKLTTVINLTISALIIIFRRPLIAMFTADNIEIYEQVVSVALGIMLVDIIAEQSRAVSQVYEYALRAAGDVTFTMVLVIISCWVCSVGGAYFFGIHCGFGLIGCWMSTALDELVRAIVTYFRWRTGKWKTMNIVGRKQEE